MDDHVNLYRVKGDKLFLWSKIVLETEWAKLQVQHKRLEQEMEEFPRALAYWETIWAQSHRATARVEHELSLTKAKAYQRCLESAAKKEEKKPTEKALENFVKLDASVVKATKQLEAVTESWQIVAAIAKGYNAKRDMLFKLKVPE